MSALLMSFSTLKTERPALFNPDAMKRLIALSSLGILLTACGGGAEEKESDLLDGILNNPGGGSSSEETI